MCVKNAMDWPKVRIMGKGISKRYYEVKSGTIEALRYEVRWEKEQFPDFLQESEW